MDYYDLRGSEGLNEVPSEELEQNLCPLAFWKLVSSKLKDHIDHELPSFEFDVRIPPLNLLLLLLVTSSHLLSCPTQ